MLFHLKSLKKTFCSTLNSWIGELVNWWFRFLMSRTGYLLSYYSILSNSEVIERRSLHPRTRFFVCVALLYEFEISWQYQKQVDALLLPLKRVKPVWAPTSFNSFLGRTNDLKVLKFGVQYFLGFVIFCCFHASYGQN